MAGPIERAMAKARNARARSGAEASAPKPDEVCNQDHTPVPPPIPRRRKIHVNKLSERYAATKWMLETAATDGHDKIISKCVRHFSQMFPGNAKANLEKASRWWKMRETTMALKNIPGSLSLSTRRARLSKKAVSGRGPKRSEWVIALYKDLLEAFERLRAAGVRFSTQLLLQEARDMVQKSGEGSSYHHSLLVYGVPIMEKLTARWIKHFMSFHKIVLRCQTGKLMLSPSKRDFIERSVAYHLGVLQRGFNDGTFLEETIENADETHFVVNFDNGKTLGFIGDNHVKYADVVSGGEPMTMMVRISGGVHATIHPPMIIFKNDKCSYPIKGVPDTVPGVCYRTSKKGWMDSVKWMEWLLEARAIHRMHGDQRRSLFVDNCPSHGLSDEVNEALKTINTVLYKLPPNATDLVQPADSFIIQKIKEVWRRRWDVYKMDCIKKGLWKDGDNGSGSGRLVNPGKRFFLKLAADSVREVNCMKDRNGESYARKAMVMTGMSLGYDGVWSEGQLTQDLQGIIAKYRNHFEGVPVGLKETLKVN